MKIGHSKSRHLISAFNFLSLITGTSSYRSNFIRRFNASKTIRTAAKDSLKLISSLGWHRSSGEVCRAVAGGKNSSSSLSPRLQRKHGSLTCLWINSFIDVAPTGVMVRKRYRDTPEQGRLSVFLLGQNAAFFERILYSVNRFTQEKSTSSNEPLPILRR